MFTGLRSFPFTGLSAFPLTPIPGNGSVDEKAFAALVGRLAAAGVDSIGALGSTGSYAYLTLEERARAARIAVEHADEVPVIVGIGALRTRQVLQAAEDAQNAGAAAVLLAPVSYQPLTDDDVYGLFEEVTANLSVPLVIYDNPGTTHFTFTDELYARLAQLPQVASIKIPALPADLEQARARVAYLRQILPDTVTVGISGDAAAATGLNAGCDAWYSVIGGTFPEPALALTRAAQAGNSELALAESRRLQPLWDLFAEHGGSLRVVAAAAAHLGLTADHNLPLPLRGLTAEERARLATVMEQLQLHA
ncbi:dihydrodipicolinate synthase family protein [Streptomyces sp. KR2]|uniref:dihydrodipicolinate synthase family protein n=1 Tax=Streptomyces sp. KR2 TaxID=1514824 RepID=UPI003F7E795F